MESSQQRKSWMTVNTSNAFELEINLFRFGLHVKRRILIVQNRDITATLSPRVFVEQYCEDDAVYLFSVQVSLLLNDT